MKKIFILLAILFFGSPVLAGYIIDITATDTNSVVAIAGNVVSDLLPLIVIFLGIQIAFIIFRNVMESRK